MTKQSWIGAQRYSACLTLEMIYWLLFLLVFLTGLWGFIAVAICIGLMLVLNWGKVRYDCSYCCYSVSQKL